MERTIKEKYLSSAALLLVATIIVKIIGAVYKIPLTAYIGATGRGYFSTAYNLFMPIHAITMGAFPVALSSLVSRCLAKGDDMGARLLKKAADRLFFIVGAAGLVFLVVFAKPYASLIASSPKSIFTILVLAPSALFSSMAVSRRAFAEGHMNMVPTAVSQIIDALFKMIFGLLFARLTMSYLYGMYVEQGNIFGMTFEDEGQALSFIYPLTSAAAMLGVTFGSIVALVYVIFYVRGKYNHYLPKGSRISGAMNELVSFSMPLVVATVIQSVSTFLDTASIQYCLSLCDSEMLEEKFKAVIELAQVEKEDVVTYLYGLYSSALDFKNLLPGITMALGVTAVPALSAAYESSNERFSGLYCNILKYTVILSAGGGAALAMYSYDVLKLFYSSSNPDLVLGCSQLLFYFGVTSVPVCLASTAVFAVQSLGYSKSLILPFVLSAVLRVSLNYLLVPQENFILYGGVISTFAGYLLIAVWSLVTVRKKTHVKLEIGNVIIKPFLVAILTYFGTKILTESLFSPMEWVLSFSLSVSVFLSLFVAFLFLFKVITPKDLKIAGFK